MCGMSWQPEPLFDDSTFSDTLVSDAVVPAPPHASLPSTGRAWTDTLGVFDLETTGIDVLSERVVTAHVGVIGPGGEVMSHRTWIADPGIEIPEPATAVHGITTAFAREHGRDSRDVVSEIVVALQELLEAGTPVVAYNAPYDFSLLKYEALRHGIRPILSPTPVIDPLVVDKAFDRYRRGKRTLDAVAEHYDVLLDAAHDASADAIAAGRVAQAIARRYADRLPASCDELHTKQIAWARAQAESLTDYFIRIGRIEPEDAVDGSWPIR